MYILLTVVLSYIIGSIPPALIIGKLFFKKDVRDYGSGNLGGSNTGRVLGKPVGLLVMILDQLKAVAAILLTATIVKNTNPDLLNLSIYLSATSVLIGHCYTCFAKFKGGKAVACSFGIIFAANIYVYLICVATYVLLLKITKLVSLSSLIIFYIATLLLLIPCFQYSQIINTNLKYYSAIAMFIYATFVVYRHRSNIERLKKGTESKIKWMK